MTTLLNHFDALFTEAPCDARRSRPAAPPARRSSTFEMTALLRRACHRGKVWISRTGDSVIWGASAPAELLRPLAGRGSRRCATASAIPLVRAGRARLA